MSDDLFADAVRQLLADQCTPAVVRAIEAHPASDAAQALWEQLDTAGFADALVGEDHGGAGLRLADLQPVLEHCGAHALPLPLGETLLARAWLAQAGLERPVGSIAFGEATSVEDGDQGDESLRSGIACQNVHLGRVADWVLVQRGQECWLLASADAQASALSFPLDAAMQWSAAACAAAPRLSLAISLRTAQACVYAAQLAGALQAVFERTLSYANERIQFGRPIGKFQAIQHQLSVIAEHAFAARMAAQIGCQCDDAKTDAQGISPDPLRVAIAKSRSSEAALEVAALSHSIHGAIGFTAEFDLQLLTRRLHAWRQTAGAESYWQRVAGRALIEQHQGLTLDLLRRATDLSTSALLST